MQKHEWKKDTDEGLRLYKALYHAGRWSLASRLKKEYDWDEDYPLNQEIWQQLRDLLWAKYQRRRCTWKIVQTIDKILLKEYGVEPPQQ